MNSTVQHERSLSESLTAEGVFREHAVRIYHLVRRMLGNAADAEDVTQQVFLQVVRKLSTFRGESAISTWLNRIAVNTALAYRRQRATRRLHEMAGPVEDFAEDGSHTVTVRHWEPLPSAMNHETHELIERAIRELPELYRDVYVLADVENLSNQEIAELLRLGVAAVKSRLHRARQLMHKALAPHFEECAA